jgi:hypothetical protein
VHEAEPRAKKERGSKTIDASARRRREPWRGREGGHRDYASYLAPALGKGLVGVDEVRVPEPDTESEPEPEPEA